MDLISGYADKQDFVRNPILVNNTTFPGATSHIYALACEGFNDDYFKLDPILPIELVADREQFRAKREQIDG